MFVIAECALLVSPAISWCTISAGGRASNDVCARSALSVAVVGVAIANPVHVHDGQLFNVCSID